jgi:AcrR family transcriptional regulator
VNAYARLDVDERRKQLLERGTELFTQYSYGELSMAEIARQAGISKALLYHYFPSKRDFFVATLQRAADELRARTEPDPAKPPLEQLTGSLEGYLELIEENSASLEKLIESATTVADVREKDFSRRELRDMLLGTLMGAVAAAGGHSIVNSLVETPAEN